MPVPYRCPKGGFHHRIVERNAIVCRKCGLALLLLHDPSRPARAVRRERVPRQKSER